MFLIKFTNIQHNQKPEYNQLTHVNIQLLENTNFVNYWKTLFEKYILLKGAVKVFH